MSSQQQTSSAPSSKRTDALYQSSTNAEEAVDILQSFFDGSEEEDTKTLSALVQSLNAGRLSNRTLFPDENVQTDTDSA